MITHNRFNKPACQFSYKWYVHLFEFWEVRLSRASWQALQKTCSEHLFSHHLINTWRHWFANGNCNCLLKRGLKRLSFLTSLTFCIALNISFKTKTEWYWHSGKIKCFLSPVLQNSGQFRAIHQKKRIFLLSICKHTKSKKVDRAPWEKLTCKDLTQ